MRPFDSITISVDHPKQSLQVRQLLEDHGACVPARDLIDRIGEALGPYFASGERG
jgi:hypothetical protein